MPDGSVCVGLAFPRLLIFISWYITSAILSKFCVCFFFCMFGLVGPLAIGPLMGNLVNVSTIAGTIDRNSVDDMAIICTYLPALPKNRLAYTPIGNSTRIMIAVKWPAVKCPVFIMGKLVIQVRIVSSTYNLPATLDGSILPERYKA